MKVLFIGNSYTYYNDMPSIFETLARKNGHGVSVFSVTKGGRYLHENLNPCDENGKTIRSIAEKNDVDILFLQEQSTAPIRAYDTFLDGSKRLLDTVKAKRTVLYATWGRKNGSETLKSLALSSEEMTDKLNEAYQNAANTLGAEISQVGLCFKYISENYPHLELYNPDLSHPSYLGSALAAFCHYAVVFGNEPKSVDSLNLTNEELEAIKSSVRSIN